MNSVTLIGNLTKDPEVRYVNTASGQKAKCRFTLAVNDGKDNANFIPVVVWDRQAENCGKFLSKGRKCAVQGKIQTGSYQKQDGTKVYTTDVVAFSVEFLSQQEQREQNEQWAQAQEPAPDQQMTFKEYNAYKQQAQQQPYSPNQPAPEMPKGFQQMADNENIPFR